MNILLVEDDKGNREMYYMILTRLGHHIHLAESVPSALQAWKDFQGVIDVIVSDFNLFELTAESILPIFKKQKPETRFILISGRSAESLPNNFIDSVDFYFCKPVPLNKLIAAIGT